MTGHLSERTRWTLVVAFAIAMAWVEAASVFYIRALVDRIVPYQADPLPQEAMNGALGAVELVREGATLVMLATLGMVAGSTWRRRAGYAALAFGTWDIFYYAFLRMMDEWPRTLLDWDILFLLPLPWWGPIIAPMSIAALMIVGGTLATQTTAMHVTSPLTRRMWRLSWLGIALGLYVFMADAVAAVAAGADPTKLLPQSFNWFAFGVAFALMAAPIVSTVWEMPRRRAAGVTWQRSS